MIKLKWLILVTFFICCSSGKKELFEISDSIIESLYTTHDSFGINEVKDHIKITSDGKFQLSPIGRLINVKIMEVVSDDVYIDLKEEIKNHYKDDIRVKDV